MKHFPLPSSLASRGGWADILALKRPAEPHVHQIEPTNHCPYSCIMCPRPKRMTRPLGFMDMDLYQKIIDEISDYSEPVRSREIELFHFGESLLHPNIDEMVGYASGKSLNVTLSVNAPQLTPKVAERILEKRPFRLIVSLDGYDEESYRQIRGKTADFSKAIENIRYLIELKNLSKTVTKTCIRMIQLKINTHYLERFIEEWEGNGISVELRPFFPWTEKDLSDLGNVQKYPPGMPCPFPWQYLVVQWDGTVVPCCRDFNAATPMGNAWRHSLKEIWNSAGYEAFRAQHRKGDYRTNYLCRDCMDIFYTDPEKDCEPVGAFLSRSEDAGKLVPVMSPAYAVDLHLGIVNEAETPYSANPLVTDQTMERLSLKQCMILYLAEQGFCVDDIALRLELTSDRVRDVIEPLISKRIVEFRPQSRKQAYESETSSLAQTVQALWQEAVSNYSCNPMINAIEYDSVFTYGDAGEIVSTLAERLSRAGVRKGDRIAVCSPIHPEALFSFWASALLGAIFVPLDFTLPVPQIQAILREVRPGIVLCDRDHADFLASPADFELVMFDDNSDTSSESAFYFSNWLGEATNSFIAPSINPDDPAVILYTSGTSGVPKGVVLTQGALCRSGNMMVSSYGWNDDDVLLSLAELHTMSGLRNPCVAVLRAGCSVIITTHSARSNAFAVTNCIDANRVSILCTVPAMIRQLNLMNAKIDISRLKSLRMVLCTGSMLPSAVAESFRESYAIPLLNYYGLTETAGLCTGITRDNAEAVCGTIGTPIQCLAPIVDDQASPLGYYEIGELLIFSDNLMTGYYHNQELTENAIRDGWFHTGDLAYRKPDGSIVLVDRKGDTFKDRRGEMVHPSEIEQALEAHPRVAEAGVCRYYTQEGDEHFTAFIVSTDPAEDTDTLVLELRKLIHNSLGTYKVPSHFYFAAALPKGTNGKLLRKKLKDLPVL